jgi:hypothetical protein
MIDLYPPDDLVAYRVALREEAREVLSGSRLRAAEGLLPERTAPKAASASASVAEISMVRKIIDGHYQGLYMRAAHTRTQLFFLPITLAVLLLAVVAVSWAAPHPSGAIGDNVLGHTTLLLWVYVFGALGALLSVTLSAIRGLTRQNYLLVSEFRVNVTRPLLGAASAAAVVAILDTSVFNIGDADADRTLVLAVALAAGFSERLLTSAIAAVVHGNGGK